MEEPCEGHSSERASEQRPSAAREYRRSSTSVRPSAAAAEIRGGQKKRSYRWWRCGGAYVRENVGTHSTRSLHPRTGAHRIRESSVRSAFGSAEEESLMKSVDANALSLRVHDDCRARARESGQTESYST